MDEDNCSDGAYLPVESYSKITGDPDLFSLTLKDDHALMGQTLEVPVLGGKDLDLHRLFVDVTTRGGIHKVVENWKWDEVVAAFPETEDAHSLLRIYESLLLRLEQIHLSGTQLVSSAATDSDQPVARPGSPPTEAPLISPQKRPVMVPNHNTTGPAETKAFIRSPLINQEMDENTRYLPVETYRQVARDPDLFSRTLKVQHALMGTNLEFIVGCRVPLLGGKELDLHRLFVEVTTRGGIHKVVENRKLDEVVAAFPEIKDADSLLHIYESLLLSYEQLYFSGTPSVSSAAVNSDQPIARLGLPPTETLFISSQKRIVMIPCHNNTNPNVSQPSSPARRVPHEEVFQQGQQQFVEALNVTGQPRQLNLFEGQYPALYNSPIQGNSSGTVRRPRSSRRYTVQRVNNHGQPAAEPQVISRQWGGLNNSYQFLPRSLESFHSGQFNSPLSQVSSAGTNLVQDFVTGRPLSEEAYVGPFQQGTVYLPDNLWNYLARPTGFQYSLDMPQNFPLSSIGSYPADGVIGHGQTSSQAEVLFSQQGGLNNSFSSMPNLYQSLYGGQYTNPLGQISTSAGANLVIPGLSSAEVHAKMQSDNLMNSSAGLPGVHFTKGMPQCFPYTAHKPRLPTRKGAAQYSRGASSISSTVPEISPSMSSECANTILQQENPTGIWHPKLTQEEHKAREDEDIDPRLSTGAGQGGEAERYNEILAEARAWREKKFSKGSLQTPPPS